MAWLATDKNKASDFLSRAQLGDRYKFNPALLADLMRSFGTLDVDRFATDANAVLPVYNTMFWEPGSSGVDAFAQGDWMTKVNFCNPPFAQVARLVRFLTVERRGARALVIVPHW